MEIRRINKKKKKRKKDLLIKPLKYSSSMLSNPLISRRFQIKLTLVIRMGGDLQNSASFINFDRNLRKVPDLLGRFLRKVIKYIKQNIYPRTIKLNFLTKEKHLNSMTQRIKNPNKDTEIQSRIHSKEKNLLSEYIIPYVMGKYSATILGVQRENSLGDLGPPKGQKSHREIISLDPMDSFLCLSP